MRLHVMETAGFLLALSVNLSAQVYGPSVTDLDRWSFSKDGSSREEVRIPHSYNAIDGHSPAYYRGTATYRTTVTLDGGTDYVLFEGAAQKATVLLDGEELCLHKGGYTPFVVKLDGEGEHILEVVCDNSEDPQLAPVSSDFNKNGGLHNPVHLLRMGTVFFSPEEYGLYRMHVSTPSVSSRQAETRIKALVTNTGSRSRKQRVVSVLLDAGGREVHRSTGTITVGPGKSVPFEDVFTLENPHLWDGVEDPYLYTAEIRLEDASGNCLDRVSTEVGYRFFSVSADKGFSLNGRSYPLRGVALHQDTDGKASALDADDYVRDYGIVKELGANFVRLAHYPHNDRAFREADRLGLLVQTEIPWVNVCGVRAEAAYFDNLHDQLFEMVVNLYNHPSIAFWGLWNEVNSWGNQEKYQGEFDPRRAVDEERKLYAAAKALDPGRLVGVTDDSVFGKPFYGEIAADYFSENRYHGWYYSFGETEKFTEDMSAIRSRMGPANVSEYGAGANPFAHTWDESQLLRPVNDFHYEEYANRWHEDHARQIARMPWLNFTSIWVLFDFPVASRKEGFLDTSDGITVREDLRRMYMNDKGLVTRDRNLRKDAFYLYKAWWNHHGTTVHIAGTRLKHRPVGQKFSITVYSNAKSLTLLRDGRSVATLPGTDDPTGVIWTFPELVKGEGEERFEVVADDGTSDSFVLGGFREDLFDPGKLVSPDIHPDGSVTIRYHNPSAREVKVNFEAPCPVRSVPMEKDERNIWTCTTPVLSPELYKYGLVVDGTPVLDPQNVLFSSGYKPHNWFVVDGDLSVDYRTRDVPHGTVSMVWYPAPGLGFSQRRMAVYLPPGYEGGTERYPVFYLMHGSGGDEYGWLEDGRAAQILDWQIANGLCKPMIVVMPNITAGEEAARGAGADLIRDPTVRNGNVPGDFERSFVPDIVGYMDRNYRTIPDKAHRAIAGLSYGGLMTLYTSLNNPDTFDYIGLFSAAIYRHWPQDAARSVYQDVPAKMDRLFENPPKLFLFAIGSDDGLVRANTDIRRMLDGKNYPYEWYETDGGHTWINWRKYLNHMLPELFIDD